MNALMYKDKIPKIDILSSLNTLNFSNTYKNIDGTKVYAIAVIKPK